MQAVLAGRKLQLLGVAVAQERSQARVLAAAMAGESPSIPCVRLH